MSDGDAYETPTGSFLLQENAMPPTPVAQTPSPAAATAAPTKARDQRGRFVTGNPGGTGNPFARQVAALRKAFLESVTTADIAAIAAALLAKAKEGDVAAAKLVLSYAVGKPEATVDPDRLDLDEWQTFKDSADMMDDLPKLVLQPHPDVPLTVLQAARPLMTRHIGQDLIDGLTDPSTARLGGAAKRSPSPVGSNGGRSKPSAATQGHRRPGRKSSKASVRSKLGKAGACEDSSGAGTVTRRL